MKNTILIIIFLVTVFAGNAQLDADSVTGMPTGTTAEITAITTAAIGSSAYNTDDDQVYIYTSTGWVASADDQGANEVNLVSPVDSNGDSTNETTVEDVVQAIIPITSASGRIFYPPSIEIDASTNIVDETKDLYAEYVAQFASANTIASNGAPSTIPIYAANELYYYVTYFDPAVFANIEINASGVMEYDIIGQPLDYNSLINVVFVVK
ncbi:hypothetical protein [Maribacter sp. 2304DJ31-5]|uniref:hypothetical protein n=1 Tax=Maribacter sp. 2304DJ31-5 TaxID=3386273 RepID=UPI0039BC2D78